MKPADLKDAAKLAIEVQNACNLSGVLHTWAECQGLLIESLNSTAADSYRRHCINIMFLSKVVSLMQVYADPIGSVTNYEDKDLFGDAYNACQILAEVKR